MPRLKLPNHGDKVVIRSDLKGDNNYGIYFSVGMEKYRGKVVTVKEVSVADCDFRIYEDGGQWTWCMRMVEKKKKLINRFDLVIQNIEVK